MEGSVGESGAISAKFPNPSDGEWFDKPTLDCELDREGPSGMKRDMRPGGGRFDGKLLKDADGGENTASAVHFPPV
jgi:hypothetical protein